MVLDIQRVQQLLGRDLVVGTEYSTVRGHGVIPVEAVRPNPRELVGQREAIEAGVEEVVTVARSSHGSQSHLWSKFCGRRSRSRVHQSYGENVGHYLLVLLVFLTAQSPENIR
jgi:hypothetical protein